MTIAPSKSGFVYVISNVRFPGWYKVGKAKDIKRRLSTYQTGDPYRRYKLIHSYPTENMHLAEAAAHWRLDDVGVPRRGEWFSGDVDEIIRIISERIEDHHE